MISLSRKKGLNQSQPYDLNLELKTESNKIEKTTVPSQYRCHGTIIGEPQETRPILYAAMAADLEEKLRNDALRNQKLEKLKRGWNTFLPKKIVQNQYNRICDQYRTCCMIVVAPDNQLCDAAARLAISHGVAPKIIDATLEGDRLSEFGQYAVGLNPFKIPESVEKNAPGYLTETAETILKVLVKTAPEKIQTNDSFLYKHTKDLMTAIVFITALHCQYVSKCDADVTELYTNATDFNILLEMLGKLEAQAEESSILSKILQSEKGKAIVAFTRNALNNLATKECLVDIREAMQKLLQNPRIKSFFSIPTEKNIDLLRSFDDGDMIIVNYGLKENTTAIGILFQLMVEQTMLNRPPVLPRRYDFTPVFEYIDNIFPLLPENWFEPVMALGRKYGVALLYSMPKQTQPATDSKEDSVRDLLFGNRTIVAFAPSNYELEYFKKNPLIEKDVEQLQREQDLSKSIMLYTDYKVAVVN